MIDISTEPARGSVLIAPPDRDAARLYASPNLPLQSALEPVSLPPTTMQRLPTYNIARITLSVLFIGLLIGASLWVLMPFLAALVWATMIVVATWPMMLAAEARLGGRRWAAVTVMTIAMLLLLVVPLVYVVLTILENSDLIVAWTQNLTNFTVPPPPRWVEELPLVGRKLAAEWATLAATSGEDLAMQAVPYVRSAIEWFADSAGGVGLTMLHFLLTLVFTAILYAQGETAATGVRRFLRRLAGERGESTAVLAAQAIRAVALGIVVTAAVQSTAAAIGLPCRAFRDAAILAAIIFICASCSSARSRPGAGGGLALLVGRHALGHGTPGVVGTGGRTRHVLGRC